MTVEITNLANFRQITQTLPTNQFKSQITQNLHISINFDHLHI